MKTRTDKTLFKKNTGCANLSRSGLVKLFPLSMALALSFSVAHAANWPQFRGPNASGVAEGAAIPIRFNIERDENVAWRTPLPGLAHAAPIIWEDTVYLATVVSTEAADLKVGLYGDIGAANDNGPQTWRLLAINKKSGEILWDKKAHEAIP